MPYRKAQAITRTIRECCSHLDALEEALRRDSGITSAMRTVLESLYERGAQTVPQVARAKRVTRQHIQTVADRLLTGGLVVQKDNPRDRRSPLLELTARGEKVCAEVRELEHVVLDEVGRVLDDHDVQVTLTTLSTLCSRLDMKRAEAVSRSRPAALRTQ